MSATITTVKRLVRISKIRERLANSRKGNHIGLDPQAIAELHGHADSDITFLLDEHQRLTNLLIAASANQPHSVSVEGK